MKGQISPEFRRAVEAEVRRLFELTGQTKSSLQSHKQRVDKALAEADYAVNAFNTQVQIAARSEPESKAELVRVMKANGEIARHIGQALQVWSGVKRTV